MKFSKLSQLILVSSIGLIVAVLMSACQLVSIDYVFVATTGGTGTGGNGQIETFQADGASGALRTGIDPVASGGSYPVSMAVTSAYKDLYVANQGSSNNIVHFTIDDTGKLTQKDTVSSSGKPVSIALNKAGTYLYVVSTSGTGANSAKLAGIPLGTDGTMGSSSVAPITLTIPGYSNDTVVPTAVTVLASDAAVYVTAYDQSAYNPGGSATSSANPGWIYGFAVGSNGALTPTAGSPYQAGVNPTALAADPTSRFVYVTDFASSEMIGYTVLSGSTLQYFLAPPTSTGKQPSALTFDPRGKFIYVTNQLDSTVSAFAIDQATGAPTAAVNVSAGFTSPTNTNPVAVIVDPALGRFVYTANYLDNSISGFRLDPTGGSLTPTQATPYPCGHNPAALAVVPHGNHAIQSVTP